MIAVQRETSNVKKNTYVCDSHLTFYI